LVKSVNIDRQLIVMQQTWQKLVINLHERTTTAKNMGILKYHPTSLISYERGWPLACLEPNQASHPGARWTASVSMETSAVWPWCRRSFQDICRGLWIIIAKLTCGLFPMIFRMVFPSWFQFASVK
jgi:hypothetical protein